MQKSRSFTKHTIKTNKPAASPNRSVPPSFNGYGINTEQFNALLSGNQLHCHETSFDKAVRKQQQLFTIYNTLERQHTLIYKIDEILNNRHGVLWLDSQIKEFKLLCPSDILMNISTPLISPLRGIEHSEIIHLNFCSLINDIFYTPLNALIKIRLADLSEHERKEWYEWCLKIDSQLIMFKAQIKSAQTFFSAKSFDKICRLAKDNDHQQQLGNMRYLFQQKARSVDNVEYDE
ncbi:MAG: hypothetical protein OEY29_00260 [Gammaproteobacteria bacterium]|nr:hypothetical protein [Gammaproteobacteria bacterium]